MNYVKEDYNIATGYKSNAEDMAISVDDIKERRTLAGLRESLPEAGISNDLGDRFKYQSVFTSEGGQHSRGMALVVDGHVLADRRRTKVGLPYLSP